MAGESTPERPAKPWVVLDMVCDHGEGKAESVALRAKAETMVLRIEGCDFTEEALNTLTLHGYWNVRVESDHWRRITAESYRDDDPDLEVECDRMADGLSALVVWVCENSHTARKARGPRIPPSE